MTLVDDRSGLEVLERHECLALLAGEEVGRLGVVSGGHPLILPVNYVLDGDTVVFRTAPGTKLDAARRTAVAFEVDRFDRGARTGWSVVVQGVADEVTDFADPALLERLARLRLDPWTEGEKPNVVRIVPRVVSGRRLRPPV